MALLDQLKLVDGAETLSQSEDQSLFAPDPVPEERPAPRRKPGRPPGSKSTKPPAPRAKSAATLQKEVTEDFIMFGEIVAMMWVARDEVCGGAFEAQVPPLATAIVSLIAHNPRWLGYFTMAEHAGLIMKCVAVVTATRPVVQAMYAHHGPNSRVAPPADEPAQGGGVDLTAFPAFSGVPRAHTA